MERSDNIKNNRQKYVQVKLACAALVCGMVMAGVFLTADAFGQSGGMMWRGGGGWERDSRYGKLFDPKTMVTISGEVLGVRIITPWRGMRQGVQMLVRTNREDITVHLGPVWFLENQDITLMPKDRVEVAGSKTIFKGKTIVIATEVRKGNQVLKLRDENGFPVWSGWRSR